MFGFLIAVVAGAVTPMLEGPLARPVARALGNHIEVQDTEVRALAFMIAMIIAGIACSVFDAGSPLGLAVGGTLGYFGMRVVQMVQRMIESRRG